MKHVKSQTDIIAMLNARIARLKEQIAVTKEYRDGIRTGSLVSREALSRWIENYTLQVDELESVVRMIQDDRPMETILKTCYCTLGV